MELKMITDLEKSIPSIIEFNYEEMKAELAKKMQKYNNLVVIEDGIKDAKADKANLNKLSRALNDSRISQERAYMQPFNDYKAKVNELIALINKPVLAIDKQIKAFEDIEKDKKFADITRFYKANVGDLIDVLPLEKILNPKWANATVTLLSVTQELIDKIMTVHSDLRTIEDMKIDCEVQMKDAYLKNLNMSEALAEKTRFEEQQKKLAEIKQKQTEQAKQAAQTATESYPVNKTFTPPAVDVKPQEQEELVDVKSIIYGTNSAFRAEMRTLLQKYGLKCEGIK